MEKITGKNNNLIKDIKKLLSSSKERKITNTFVVEGVRLVFDVLNSDIKVKAFLFTDSVQEKYSDNCRRMISLAEKSYLISHDVAQRISDTKSSQGVFAVCEMKSTDFALDEKSYYIALDNVQDAGNLGTIIRTAEALGIDGIITFGGCDIYNPKVLRASMGSVFRMNIRRTDDLTALINDMKKSGMKVYASTPDKNSKDITSIDFLSASVCVIGNEANGVSNDVIAQCDDLITVKMTGNAESLNASVAAAIIMWEMLR